MTKNNSLLLGAIGSVGLIWLLVEHEKKSQAQANAGVAIITAPIQTQLVGPPPVPILTNPDFTNFLNSGVTGSY